MTLSWFLQMRHTVDEPLFVLAILIGYLVLAAYCALYFIPFGLMVKSLSFGVVQVSWYRQFVQMGLITATWVAAEYVRGLVFTGFSWNSLGVSQYQNAPLIQVAAWGGVPLISALIIWMNVAVYLTFARYIPHKRVPLARPHIELMAGVLPLALAIAFGMQQIFKQVPAVTSHRVALIQPNISQTDRREYENKIKIRRRYEELSQAALRAGEIDLLVWPETALPDVIQTSPESRQLIREMLVHQAPLLLGAVAYQKQGDGYDIFNAALYFDTHLQPAGIYHKRHLVPFGEYVPLPKVFGWLSPLDSAFTPGKLPVVLSLRQESLFAPLICFEDTVSSVTATSVRAGAQWLVNLTNDAWFDPSSQSEQHLAHAVFRCVEHGLPMVRCCNTGVSAFIDRYGRIHRRLAAEKSGFLIADVDIHESLPTFYTEQGDLFAKLALLVTLCSTGIIWKRRKSIGQ
jgi:apolipoprotein N-acyltransferase